MTANRPHLARRIPLAALALFLLAGAIAAIAAIGTGQPATAEAAPLAVDFQRVSIDAPATTEPTAFELEQRAAFLADLLGPDTDVTEAQAADLVEGARSACSALSTAPDVAATYAATVADLVAAGWTEGEAGKLVDTAVGTYCPALVSVLW